MILRNKDYPITKNMTESEKELGVDLKLNSDGDLILNNLGDFELIAGGANAGQAAILKINTEPGGLIYHPSIGTNLQIGEKVKDAFLLKTQLVKSLSQDPRFENINVKVEINGDVVFLTINIGIVNTGLQIPLKFVIP